MERNIPNRNRDLVRYVRRRQTFRIVGYVLWLLFFFIAILSYAKEHSHVFGSYFTPAFTFLCYLLAAAVGFAVFRMWKIFTDATFEGVIVESGLSHTYTSSSDPGAYNKVNYEFRLHSYLTVRTKKGRLRRVQCEQKPGFYLYYYPGTYICRLSGLPYPIADPTTKYKPSRNLAAGAEDPHDDLSGGYLCAACGFFNKSLACSCGRCGFSLIDPNELFGHSSAE